MEDICKKFPKICNCPYKDDIDRDLKNNKSPYYVAKWLKNTECPISESTVRAYQKYLISIGEIEIKQKQASPSQHEDDLLTLLEKKTNKALKNLELESANPNVQVQFILGALKLLVGTRQQLDINADVTSEVTTNLLAKIKEKRVDLDDLNKH
jgi:hypothetical protein